jgi:DNA-binding NtrC family response regulator
MDLFCKENKMPVKIFSTDAKKKLLNHPFPGNIRELKSVIELASVMAEGNDILPEHLNIVTQNVLESFALKDATLKEFNIKLLQYYLDLYNSDVLRVAKKLDVGKSTIYRMIQNKELIVNKKYFDESVFN